MMDSQAASKPANASHDSPSSPPAPPGQSDSVARVIFVTLYLITAFFVSITLLSDTEMECPLAVTASPLLFTAVMQMLALVLATLTGSSLVASFCAYILFLGATYSPLFYLPCATQSVLQLGIVWILGTSTFYLIPTAIEEHKSESREGALIAGLETLMGGVGSYLRRVGERSRLDSDIMAAETRRRRDEFENSSAGLPSYVDDRSVSQEGSQSTPVAQMA